METRRSGHASRAKRAVRTRVWACRIRCGRLCHRCSRKRSGPVHLNSALGNSTRLERRVEVSCLCMTLKPILSSSRLRITNCCRLRWRAFGLVGSARCKLKRRGTVLNLDRNAERPIELPSLGSGIWRGQFPQAERKPAMSPKAKLEASKIRSIICRALIPLAAAFLISGAPFAFAQDQTGAHHTPLRSPPASGGILQSRANLP